MSVINIVLLVALGIIILYFILVFNNFVMKNNSIKETFATIDVFLKKRYDLIPNLVQSAQEYMKFEKELLTNITALRSKATNDELTPDERVKLDNEINRQINGIMVAVEAYPNLKADQRFNDVNNSMMQVEDELQASRRTYNAAVVDFNNYLQMIPSNIVGKMMGYNLMTLFEASEKERQNVNIKELFNS